MKYWSEMSRRNRTAVVLFTVMVLLPSIFLSVVSLRTIRTEDARLKIQQGQRQMEIAELVNADLNEWLFSMRPDGASFQALLKFRVAADRPVFPDLNVSVRSDKGAGPFPSTLRDGQLELGDEPVTDVTTVEEIYYPRIEAFLRDLKAGNNSGAQYFRRLKAIIVLMPDGKGFVLGTSRLREHLNQKLSELTANEDFRSAILIPETNESSVPGGDAIALKSFPPFYVTFIADDSALGSSNLRINMFRYSMVLLLLVTVLGVFFMYRAASHEAKVSQLQTNFVSIVSHEFRTPLSSILVLSERLESSRVSDKHMLQEYHSTLRQDAKRLSLLIDRLLDFAQLEEGKKTFAFTKVNVFLAAAEAVNAFDQSAKGQVQLVEADGGEDLQVTGDRTAIIQCVQNLIENAIKYSQPAAPVTVSYGREAGGIFIEVRDQGIGIAAGEQQKIFDKFYRAPNARLLSVQGTGIGLAVVRRIINAHNGSVVVHSEPGQGSRFRLVFPNGR
jgi:signal transduction histidine kinase